LRGAASPQALGARGPSEKRLTRVAPGRYGESMTSELGERLVDVGLVTRSRLARLGPQPDAVGLARALVDGGLLSEALAGFFLSEGFGPLQTRAELDAADPALRRGIDPALLEGPLALPVRRTPTGVLVAMAVPSERLALAALGDALDAVVLPVVARLDELRAALLSFRAPAEEPEAEPLVLARVRRRAPAPLPSALPPSEAIPESVDEGEPIALVRHKPVTTRPSMSGPGPSLLPTPSIGPKPPAASSIAAPALGPLAPAPGSERPRAAHETHEYARPDARERPAMPPSVGPSARLSTSPASRSSAGVEAAADRWDLPPPAGASTPPGSVSPGADPIERMASARDRDELVRWTCEAAGELGRSVVFLALRKGVLKGWDGRGQGISRDAVRNLWIPASSESVFQRAIGTSAPVVGTYGAGIADGLFRAAVGSRGGDVAVWPVAVDGKIAGLLCVDDLRPEATARDRLDAIAAAASAGLRRLVQGGRG